MAVQAQLPEMLALARRAAAEAAEVLRGVRARDVRAKANPRDLVTEWDLRSEEVIRACLSGGAPDVVVIGEEGGSGAGVVDGAVASAAGGARWYVDPIDGTLNFAHGLPLWAISIGLQLGDDLAIGVVHAPALGWEFYAHTGGGAWLVERGGPPVRLEVSAVGQLDHALLVTGFPSDRASRPDNNFAEWEHFKRVASGCRRLGAASLDLCLVARGALDGYWERGLRPWDLAAGAVIVREAGGGIAGTAGGPFDLLAGDVVAANATLAPLIVAELAAVASTGRPR